ncbi:hypothetical protein ABMC88_11145 [Sulfitobacter sp. HNIBRBA2951]|uniref:hypothetical protein n=1 Tax=Sulfitobacter aquimarinus TaxID=3158557 RepID=UPI0032DFBB65
MTNLKKNASIALIALFAASPVAALAEPMGSSPELGVKEDPQENVEDNAVSNTSSGFNTLPLYESYDEADVVDEVKGSIHKGDAKRDQ